MVPVVESLNEPASDAHALMLNKDTCVLYELFSASWNAGRPAAGSGAVFDLKTHDLRPMRQRYYDIPIARRRLSHMIGLNADRCP